MLVDEAASIVGRLQLAADDRALIVEGLVHVTQATDEAELPCQPSGRRSYGRMRAVSKMAISMAASAS